MAKKVKNAPRTVIVHGLRKEKPPSKTHQKKIKSAENYLKKIKYAHESGHPITGHSGLPKVVKKK